MVCEVIFLLAILCLGAEKKAIIHIEGGVAREIYHHNTHILDLSNYGDRSTPTTQWRGRTMHHKPRKTKDQYL